MHFKREHIYKLILGLRFNHSKCHICCWSGQTCCGSSANILMIKHITHSKFLDFCCGCNFLKSEPCLWFFITRSPTNYHKFVQDPGGLITSTCWQLMIELIRPLGMLNMLKISFKLDNTFSSCRNQKRDRVVRAPACYTWRSRCPNKYGWSVELVLRK